MFYEEEEKGHWQDSWKEKQFFKKFLWRICEETMYFCTTSNVLFW